MLKKTKAIFVLCTLLFYSCGSQNKKEGIHLRNLIKQGSYTEAISYLKENKLYDNEKSKLLHFLQIGMLYHRSKNYNQSNLYFRRAKELKEKLYTKSISKKAATFITNDTSDIYYGEVYEISLLYFYMSLNHLMNFQLGVLQNEQGGIERKLSPTQKRNELFSARANIVAWNSYLDEMSSDRSGKKIFKDDLLAKVFGGLIHEMIDKSSERQISLHLYKEAQKMLIKNYGAYKFFNSSPDKFIKDYKLLPKFGLQSVEKKYIKKTKGFKALDAFLRRRIFYLISRERPYELTRAGAKLKIKNKEKFQSSKGSVSILFQQGVIPAKRERKHYYGLSKALNDPNKRGGAIFASALISTFANSILGLSGVPSYYTPGRRFIGINTTQIATDSIAISFELPEIKREPLLLNHVVVIKNEQGKIISKKEIPIIDPLGDIAKEAIDEHSSFIRTKIGARLALKHAAAILSSFATYSALKAKGMSKSKSNFGGNDYFAKTAALLQYAALTKGIELSEFADLRHWSSLPQSIGIEDIQLRPGDYEATILKGEQVVQTQRFLVSKGKRSILNFFAN